MQVQPLRRCLQIAPHLSHPALGRGKADPVTRGIERPAHQRGIVTPPLVEATPDFDRKFFNGFHHRTNITFLSLCPHIRATISLDTPPADALGIILTRPAGESLKPAKPLVLFRFFITLQTGSIEMNAARKYSIAWKGLSEGEKRSTSKRATTCSGFSKHRNQRRALRREGESLRAARQLRLEISIRSSVVVECDRCLSDCSVPIDYEGELLVKFSDEVREYDGDTLWLSPSEDFRGSDAIYLRKHRPFSALSAGAPRRGVRSGYVGTLPHRFRAGVRNDRERNATAGKRGLGLRTMDRTTVAIKQQMEQEEKDKKH